MRRNIGIILTLLSGVLIFFGTSVAGRSTDELFPTAHSVIGDLLIIAAVGAQFLIVKGFVPKSNYNTMRRLGRLWLSGIFVVVLLIGSNFLLQPTFHYYIFGFLADSVFINNIFIKAIFVFVSCLLAVYIFVQLHGFILIKRKRYTKNLILGLYLSVLFYIVFSIVSGRDYFDSGFRPPEDFIQSIAFLAGFLAFFFIVMSSYRNAWVNYLNKKQKIYILLG
ncbi:hypothetical protein ACFL6L_04950, partial [candidate division KSB1 bacterium]